MARLNTQQLIVKISKIQRDLEEDNELITSEAIAQLEAIITELLGSGVVVEVDLVIDK